MPELRYFSFSRADNDSKCERARYNGSEWGGTGLTPVSSGWDLIYGDIIHQWLEYLAKNGAIPYNEARKQVYEAAKEAAINEMVARDWAALAEGHLRGFVKCVWSRWMKEYEIVESERMRSWDASWSGGLSDITAVHRFRYRQDILLRNRFDGSLVYIDYKTTSDDSPKWIASWAKHPQLHSSAFAMKQQGIDVNYILIQGLYKGWKDKKTGGPGSIFCKGWVNREYSMMPEYSYDYKRTKGWETFSVANEFDDLSEWVANMPEAILTAQFPQTGPIAPREDIGALWFRQQLIREAEVAEAVQELQRAETQQSIDATLDKYFRQNFTKCQPAFGYECEFKNLCWIPSIGNDPLGSGEYKRREQVFEDGTEHGSEETAKV